MDAIYSMLQPYILPKQKLIFFMCPCLNSTDWAKWLMGSLASPHPHQGNFLCKLPLSHLPAELISPFLRSLSLTFIVWAESDFNILPLHSVVTLVMLWWARQRKVCASLPNLMSVCEMQGETVLCQAVLEIQEKIGKRESSCCKLIGHH